MTRAQNMIVNYINQQFVPGSVTIIPVGESHVKITDKNKESLTFTVNIFGDIIVQIQTTSLPKQRLLYLRCSFSGTKERANKIGNYNWH